MSRHAALAVAIAIALVTVGPSALAGDKSLVGAATDGVPTAGASAPGGVVVVDKASRAQTTYTSRAAFQAAHGGTLPVEGYENGNVPPGGVAACVSPMNTSTSDPSCVSPGDILPGFETASLNFPGANGLAMLGSGFAGNPTRTVVANYFTDSENINFDATTRGYVWGANVQAFFSGVQLTISVFDPALVLTGSYTVPSSNAGTFFGVIDDSSRIARVNIFDATGANSEGADDSEWGPVPVELQSFEVE